MILFMSSHNEWELTVIVCYSYEARLWGDQVSKVHILSMKAPLGLHPFPACCYRRVDLG